MTPNEDRVCGSTGHDAWGCRKELAGMRGLPSPLLMAGARAGGGTYAFSPELGAAAPSMARRRAILPAVAVNHHREVHIVSKSAVAVKPITEGASTLENLRLLPEPQSMGPRHKPVPHWAVAEAVEGQLKERGMGTFVPRYVLSQEGQRLDATYDFSPDQQELGKARMLELREAMGNHIFVPKELQESAGAMLVMTHANDKSRALRIEAAIKVYICTNLAIGTVAGGNGMRKHTGDEPWETRIDHLLEKAFGNFQPFTSRIGQLQNAMLTDEQAGGLIVQVMRLPYQPVATSKFIDVVQTYFGHETADVAEPNRWSLHNAFTRVMRDTPLKRQVETSADLMRILSESLPLEPSFVDGN
jgi:hypothetical protein